MDYNLRYRPVNPTTRSDQTEEISQSDAAEGLPARISAEPQAQASRETEVAQRGISSMAGPEVEIPSGEKTLGSDTSARPTSVGCSDISETPSPPVLSPMVVTPIPDRPETDIRTDVNPADTQQAKSGSHTGELTGGAAITISSQYLCQRTLTSLNE